MVGNVFTLGRMTRSSLEAFVKPYISVQSSNPSSYYVPLANKDQGTISVDRSIVENRSGGQGFSRASISWRVSAMFTDLVESETRTYLLVSTYDGMVFFTGEVSQPHLHETFVRVGAEGRAPIAWSGYRADTYKSQLFALKEGESILFCDAQKEITRITAKQCREELEIRRATTAEVASFVLDEANTRGRNTKTCNWCFSVLKELGDVTMLSRFRSQFPEYAGR
jgi:hypothetical protein